MKLLRMLTMLWVVSLFFIAPAVLHAEGRPDSDETTRIQLEHYSILPPPGSNWRVLQKEKDNMVFNKDLKSITHMFRASVFTIPLPISFETPEDFLEFVKKSKSENIEPGRFRMLESEMTLDTIYGPYCVKYHQKAIDRAASDKTIYYFLDTSGYTCLHPDLPELSIDIGYYERYRAGESSIELREEGEQFIKGLEFLPVESE